MSTLPVIFGLLVAASMDSGVSITPPTSAKFSIIYDTTSMISPLYARTNDTLPDQSRYILEVLDLNGHLFSNVPLQSCQVHTGMKL